MAQIWSVNGVRLSYQVDKGPVCRLIFVAMCPVVLQVECSEAECQLVLERNPLEWSVEDVVTFITSTDCAALAKIFQEQVHTINQMYL